MAKKKVIRKKRVQAQKKPEPLPKSVQALLRYLGGSDVKVASSARQPAMVAQQFAPQQQQQQQQQYQQAPPPVRRQQPVGQTIAASPLARLAPPPPAPQPTPAAQAPIIIKQSKKEAPSSSDVATLRSKVGLLEQGLTSFKQQAGQVAVALSEGIRKSIKASQHYQEQDYDPLDSEVDMSPVSKPFVAEQGLQVATVAPKPARASSVPPRASAAYEAPEIEAGQGAYAAGEYIKAVAAPEMSPKVTLKGRPRLTEQQKAANAVARKEEKAQRKELLKTAGEQLYQEGQSATKALEALTKTIAVKQKVKLFPKTGGTLEALMRAKDPATQVEILASAGAAAAQPTQQRGKSVLEMMGGGAAKK